MKGEGIVPAEGKEFYLKDLCLDLENSDKILTFVSLRADVNFESFADAFWPLENSYKFLPILFIL